MLILPNEWVLDYLTPGTDKPHLSTAFVEMCRARGHSLLIRREGNFRQKLFRYSKLYSLNQSIRAFVSLVLRDLRMVRIIEEGEVPARGQELPTIPADDKYLVEVLYEFPEAVLVTTDAFLAEQVLALRLRAVLFRDNVAETIEAVERVGKQA